MGIIWSIVVGGIAGWLAGALMKGKGYGLLQNILLGIVGGALGGWVFRFFGFTAGEGFIPQLITAVIGAVIIISLYRAIKKK
ncbi:MAG: GlsB/YeaQ/YmgE family stress response membrane protein [Bacteroidia bacterium]